MGANLGRLIYFMDAAIDYEKDIKNDVFNPYKSYLKCKKMIDNETALEIKNNLMTFAGKATQEFEKLPIVRDSKILQNILYEGL